MSAAQVAFESTQALYGRAVQGLRDLRWQDVPQPVRAFIEEHPALSAVQLLMLLVLTCPGLVATPLLGMVGFSSVGPVAGASETDMSTSPQSCNRELTPRECRQFRGVVSSKLRRHLGLQRAAELGHGWLCCWSYEWGSARSSSSRWRCCTLVQELRICLQVLRDVVD